MFFSKYKNEKKLFKLIIKNDIKGVEELLKTTKLDLNFQDDTNKFVIATALHHAAALGHLEIVKLLVEAGANIFALSAEGTRSSPLGWAVGLEHIKVIDYLISKDPEAQAKIDWHTLYMLIKCKDTETSVPILKKLNDQGYEVIGLKSDKGQSLFYEAIRVGKKSVIQFFLDHGALGLKIHSRKDAFFLATQRGEEIARLMLQDSALEKILKTETPAKTVETTPAALDPNIIIFETKLDADRTLCEIFNFQQYERISYLKEKEMIGPITRENFQVINAGLPTLEEAYNEHIRRGGTSNLAIANIGTHERVNFSPALLAHKPIKARQ